MRRFTVSDLADDQLESAYAPIRTLAPDVSLERWLTYARALQQRGGILGLFGGDGMLFGLLTYRRDDCLRYGPVMLVDNFVTFELNRASPGRKALCEAIEALARAQACAAVRMIVGGRGHIVAGSAKTSGWIALGHNAEAIVLTKRLDCRCGDRLLSPVFDLDQ
jgi:hypothetical protein